MLLRVVCESLHFVLSCFGHSSLNHYFVDVGKHAKILVDDELQDTRTTATGARKEEIPFILRYPSQCIRCVEDVVWCSNVSHALACEDKNDLKALWYALLLYYNLG